MPIYRPIDPRAYLSYDPETGFFTWLKTQGKAQKGEVAGTIGPKGHVIISVCGQRYLAHRLAWLLHYGEAPILAIDHINRVPSDNRICNLRLATNAQNLWNRGPSRISTSGIKGVYWWSTGRKWKAQAMTNGKMTFLGHFKTKEDAAAAFHDYEKRVRGEYAPQQ